VTESCVADVGVELDGCKVTLPVDCGLLNGTFRDELLERAEIAEQVVTVEDLMCAGSVGLNNSVRKWRQCKV